MSMSKQHVQVPNNMTLEGELTPKDLLVYTILKSYVSKKYSGVLSINKFTCKEIWTIKTYSN